jgi:hypothetical protein
MKRVFLITAAEEGGAMMVTEAICSSGVYGDGGHRQGLDGADFATTPDEMVIRRSFPYGDGWPDVVALVGRLRDAGYVVVPVLVIRNVITNIEAQMRHGYARTHRMAHDSIAHAHELIYSQFAEVGCYPHVIGFEAFVKRAEVRRAFFEMVGLAEPAMVFRDSVSRYRTDQEPVVFRC